jgi:hypothetical protein
VEGEKFSLAPTGEVVEASDADRGERAGRRRTDLGKVDV